MRPTAMQMALIADDVRAGDYASAADRCEVLLDQMMEDGVDVRIVDMWMCRSALLRAMSKEVAS